MGQETSSRRQAHSTGHQRCHKRNAGKTNQLDIDDPTESGRQSFTDLGQLSLPQRDRPEDVGDRWVEGQPSDREVQANLPPEQRVLGVKLCPLAEVNDPENAADQQGQGCNAVNNVGNHHRGGFSTIWIGFDQATLHHQCCKAQHEAEVVNVRNAGALGDVSSEGDRQVHHTTPKGSATLAARKTSRSKDWLYRQEETIEYYAKH